PAASIETAREGGWLEEYDVAPGQLERVDPDDAVRIGDLTVRVTSANDPDAEEPVSYLIRHQSGTFFHAGDARPGGFGGVGRHYDIDLGAVAFGSVGMIPDKETREPERTRWYNDENGAIEVANELRLDRMVPTHWDMWKGMSGDPTALHHHAGSFEYPDRLDVVEIGDRLDL
ncbi:MAG: MBL fold metallo-hydrolase, partial [Haloarculaceae archaeon]